MLGWLAAIAPVLLFAAGLGTYFFNPCQFRSYCEYADDVYILSEDGTKRDLMKRALPVARERFNDLFAYEPLTGTLLLDRAMGEPLPIKIQSKWRLRYDPSGPQKLSDVLAEIGEAQGTELYLAEGEDFDMGGHGVADTSGDRVETNAHEVCHAFFSNAMGNRPTADVLEEIAAISCESDKGIGARVADFKRLFGETQLMPWDDFLQLEHPLKSEPEFAQLVGGAVDKAKTSVSFTIDNRSPLGRNIDRFYSQSALFISVWKELCPKQNILGDMAAKLSSGVRFSNWIKNKTIKCGPRNVEQFDKAVKERLARA
jgi:hypothetical protein